MARICFLILFCLGSFCSYSQSKWLYIKYNVFYKEDLLNCERWNYFSDSLMIEKYSKRDKLNFDYISYGDSMFVKDSKYNECLISFKCDSTEGESIKKKSETKIIQGYVCNKVVQTRLITPRKKGEVILWVTNDKIFKDFYMDWFRRKYGFILEVETDYQKITLDSLKICFDEPSIINEFRQLPRCDLTLSPEIKPLFDAAIKQAQDEIDSLIEKK